jgi:hypothetical protein
MMTKTLSLTNTAGSTFIVVIVRRGERYGRDKMLVHAENDPLVEFYDAECAGRPGFDPEGQFVSRYYRSTLLEHHTPGVGLDLCGYEPKWKIDADEIAQLMRLLEEEA